METIERGEWTHAPKPLHTDHLICAIGDVHGRADHHIKLPKEWQAQFSQVIQRLTDATSREISSQEIWQAFEIEYVTQPNGRFELLSFEDSRVPGSNQVVRIKAEVRCDGETCTIQADGNGPVNAFSKAMREAFGLKFRFKDYAEHTRSVGSDAEAVAYIELKTPDENGKSVFGVGIATDITLAPIKGVISACNRLGSHPRRRPGP